MNKYAELKKKQGDYINANSPLKFAFNEKQFKQIMDEWGLDIQADLDKIYSAGYGGYYLKTDSGKLDDMLEKLDSELKEAIASDKTGDGFIYDMFYYELENHEYGYTRDLEDTLMALDYTYKDIENNPLLEHGLLKAVRQITKEEEE